MLTEHGKVYAARYPRGQKLLQGTDWHGWCRYCKRVVTKFDFTAQECAEILAAHAGKCHTPVVPSVLPTVHKPKSEEARMTSPVHATTQESGRFYTHPGSGEKYWSVSTISKALAKPFLIPWAAKMAGECAVEEWDYLATLKPNDRLHRIKSASARSNNRASAKGNQVHAFIEDWIRRGQPEDYDIGQCERDADLLKWNEAGEKPITKNELVPYFEGFKLWVAKFDAKFIHSETTVWNKKEKYAGTLDLIAELPHFQLPGEKEPGCFAILDAKSGKGIYPEVGLQLSAYARAEFYLDEHGNEKPLPPVEAAFALHVQPGVSHMIPVKIEDDVYNSFLYIREAFRFSEVISKTVLGPEVK